METDLNLITNNHLTPAPMQIPLKILVCDEDPGVSEQLKTLLEPEGFYVSSAGPDEEAVIQVARERPDVIVLVLDLPNQAGIAACQEFRRCSDAPILVLSSNGKANFAEQILDAGADDYLVKPITNNLVIASINKLARRMRSERDANKAHIDPTL